ncbi:MAG: hypothetical protein U0228_34510 [Myxococcaceae bacterium]
MSSLSKTLLVVTSLCCLTSLADEPKLKGSKKEGAPKLDLGLPKFGEIPKDQKLESAKSKTDEQNGPSTPKVDEGYSVVRVVHGKSFIRAPDGAKSATPYNQVTVTPGNPWQTEKFSTVVRVKSPGKKGSSIDVVILDQRGDTVMEASGQLRFGNGVEAEWQVDWEPTAIRNPGDFQVLVRVGGNPMGTFPLKLATAETPPPAK